MKIDPQAFIEEMNHATELMHGGDIKASGEIYQKLYSQLCMNTYRQRLVFGRFDKVFFGLSPDNVMGLLFNRVGWFLNACKTKEALSTIQVYKQVEKDFRIRCGADYAIARYEIEAFRRIGDNNRALKMCDELLRTDISRFHKAEVLIVKGSIESEESHQVFGINSLSLALAEAEADGTPALIAKCYLEMSKMIGTHYPSLALSFLWKARILYEKAREEENVAFCKERMAMAYFLLWNKSGQKEKRFMNEALRLVNREVNRDIYKHPGAQFSFDRLRGLLNRDLKLIESTIDFFESINAYGDVCLSAEDYIKTALELGNRDAAKYGAARYEKAAIARNDDERVAYIRGIDLDYAVARWNPEPKQKELPNLLDVLEMIAFDEERFHLEKNTLRYAFPTHYQEGKFSTVVMRDGRTRLYPCTLYPYRYFRGQSDKLEGKKCQPSLYRGLSDVAIFHERLCLKELELLVSDYPLTRVFENEMMYNTPEGYKPISFHVDTTALGQHYGIRTDVLDLTADKWVAAFFASTDYKNKEYTPHKREDEGVMYIYSHMPPVDEKDERLSAVGLQPFSRPGCQAGLVFKMKPEEDFNTKAKRIVFKHDAAIAELIFNYCNRSKKLFPDEILEDKVDEIRKSPVYSKRAFENTIKEYYNGVEDDVLQGYLRELNIGLQEERTVKFSKEELMASEERWNREKEHLFDNVHVQLMYTGPFEIKE